jgi:hypothetical protein
MTTLPNGLQELTADEIDTVAGALGIMINLGFVKLAGSITKDGVSGHVKVGDGKGRAARSSSPILRSQHKAQRN